MANPEPSTSSPDSLETFLLDVLLTLKSGVDAGSRYKLKNIHYTHGAEGMRAEVHDTLMGPKYVLTLDHKK